MKTLITILIGLLVVGCGKEQTTNTNESSSTPTITAKKKEVKETPTSTSWVSDPNDPNNVIIEEAIREELNKPTGELTKADLEKVTELDLTFAELTDVTGLGKLSQLKTLYLYSNNLTHVKGLEKLMQLKVLALNNNRLTEVKGLEKLTKLTELDLFNNNLTNVKGLENLTQLKELSLHSNYDLTKAQITELQKALPKCKITHDAKK